MRVERVGQTAHGLEVRDREAIRPHGIHRRPTLPHSGERVLEKRKLVLLGGNLIEDPIHQRRFGRGAEEGKRTHDGLLQLVAAQARRQELRARDSLGQSGKLVAARQEFRAHRQ